MEKITISNGDDTFERKILKREITKNTSYLTINICNLTNRDIEARIEGFGVKDKNSKLQPYHLNTGGINISAQQSYSFRIPAHSSQFPITSTIYRLYAHALMIKFQNNNDSEIHFPEPLNKKHSYFTIKSYNTNQGPRLEIEN
jgi:hypothetical protein